MRGRAISEFLDKLADGDPVAIGFVAFFVVLGIIAAFFVLMVRRKLKQDDEAQARKYGRKPPK